MMYINYRDTEGEDLWGENEKEMRFGFSFNIHAGNV